MKKVQRKLNFQKWAYQKDHRIEIIFCAGQGNQGQSTKVLRSKDNYTEVTLSTYKKFRIVIPNFL